MSFRFHIMLTTLTSPTHGNLNPQGHPDFGIDAERAISSLAALRAFVLDLPETPRQTLQLRQVEAQGNEEFR